MTTAGESICRDERAISHTIARALTQRYAQAPARPPARTSACDILDRLLIGTPSGLMRALEPCIGDLHWRAPGFGKLPPAFSVNLAVTELIGPDGLFPAENVRIGLLIQREGFQYPLHQHAAEEMYFVLQGTAKWALDDCPPIERAAGSFVHHQSHQPHGIETLQDPLCALWGWAGDVAGASYRL